jgi:putative addiction module component (TIGR02574 family)
MTSDLVAEVLNLPISERLNLIEEIWDSLPGDAACESLKDLSAMEAEELDRRANAHMADPKSAISWETAQLHIRGRFGFDLQ